MDCEKENVTAILEKNTYVDHKCIYSGNLKILYFNNQKNQKTQSKQRHLIGMLWKIAMPFFKQLGTSGKSHMTITSSKILKQQHERLRISLKMVIQRNQIVSKYPL